MIKPIAILLTLAGVVSVTEAEAQSLQSRVYAPPTSPGKSSYSGPARMSSQARVPSRSYVASGAYNFPFHGVPYGHPYERWTWPMMSGSYANGLARYYDPPVK